MLRPNIIVSDEPELGLHPAALDVFAETIRKKSMICCKPHHQNGLRQHHIVKLHMALILPKK